MPVHTGVVEEESIVWLRVADQPFHGLLHVLLGRNLARVLLIIRQDNHVLPLVAIALVEEPRHVGDVVDAAAQLALLAKVVDADEESLAATAAVGVLESVALRRAAAEGLRALRRRRTCSLAGAHTSHGIAVGVVALGRRSVRGRILVLLRRGSAVLRRRGRTPVIALRRSIALRRRATMVSLRRRTAIPLRGRRTAVSLRGRGAAITTVLRRAIVAVSWSRTAAVAPARGAAVVLLGTVASLAWVSRHDDEGGWWRCLCDVCASWPAEERGVVGWERCIQGVVGAIAIEDGTWRGSLRGWKARRWTIATGRHKCVREEDASRRCIIGYKATGSRLTEGQQHHSGASIEAEQRIYEWFSLGILCCSTSLEVTD